MIDCIFTVENNIFKYFLRILRKLQNNWKNYIIKKNNAKLIINNRLYSYNIRKKYLKILFSTVKIQSIIRRFLDYKSYTKLKSAITIQTIVRTINLKTKFKFNIVKYRSSIKIQRQFRVYIRRKVILNKLSDLLNLNNKLNYYYYSLKTLFDLNYLLNIYVNVK
jgi:hypothetical protein